MQTILQDANQSLIGIDQFFKNDDSEKRMKSILIGIKYYKQYYTKVMLILIQKQIEIIPFKEKSKFFRYQNIVSTINMNEIFNPTKLSETLRFFKTTERQQKYSILIDIISFSIIPSIFCMFINEDSFNLYIARENEVPTF